MWNPSPGHRWEKGTNESTCGGVEKSMGGTERKERKTKRKSIFNFKSHVPKYSHEHQKRSHHLGYTGSSGQKLPEKSS